uniref:Uncharacterized protein n=1 Tax=Romanomermis culicivorax TaxID=13658 RepID=A0A915KFG6_ROMCU
MKTKGSNNVVPSGFILPSTFKTTGSKSTLYPLRALIIQSRSKPASYLLPKLGDKIEPAVAPLLKSAQTGCSVTVPFGSSKVGPTGVSHSCPSFRRGKNL